MIDAADVIADLLGRGHAVEFQVRGDSMHPTIREGEMLHVEPVSRVRVGDIVLVRLDRGLTAHRVVRVEGETIVTRGDNAPSEDGPCELSRVLGVVHLGVRRRIAAALLRIARAVAMPPHS